MASLTQKLSDIFGDAFEAQGLDRAYGLVKVADRPDLAQFQCNGAMAAAKFAKKNPREVSQKIVECLQSLPPSIPPASGGEDESKDSPPQAGGLGGESIFAKVEIAGPGFINLSVTDEFLSAHLKEAADDAKAGAPDLSQGAMAFLDYGGPNIAKAMHVGHLRAAIIGDSVRRTLAFCGYDTLGDVHLGDWGTHMGLLIDHYFESGEEAIITGVDINDPHAIEAAIEDMAVRYPAAASKAKEDEAAAARGRTMTVRLQNKEEPYFSLWKKIREISIIAIRKNYEHLGVHFDLWKGEADVHDYIAPMVDDLRRSGYAVESDGAWIVPVARNDDKKEFPPLILYKRDGAVMYGTTDMATIVERVKLYNPAKIVYIVDQRQSLHFEQVFRAVRLANIVHPRMELTHAGFGTMNGPDGRPFKTREGGVLRLSDLIAMAIEKALIRMEEASIAADMGTAEKEDVAKKVAIAAIKFADLQNARAADYVFDIDRLTSFEGKTGPYLLYQAVRIKSLLKKAQYSPPHPPRLRGGEGGDIMLHDADRALALLLTEFPDAVRLAAEQYMPHYMCDYAYRLAQGFSSFYGNCHILSETDEALCASRLALCAMTYKRLELALSLLGIEIPERM
jgi:arginyl-tRNA synthetase